MSKPQSPELHRSGRNPALDPDNAATRIQASPAPTSSGPSGPVPEENRPGHRPAEDQDKPGPEVLAEKFGHDPSAGAERVGSATRSEREADRAVLGRVRRRAQLTVASAALGVARGADATSSVCRRVARLVDPDRSEPRG